MISFTADSTFLSNTCCSFGRVFDFAREIAFSAASITPVLLSAEISTTGQPRLALILSRSSLFPLFSSTSSMLTAITTGTPSSVTCEVRYKFLSRFVPSIIFSTASGFSLRI